MEVMRTYKYKFYHNRGQKRLVHLIETHCEVYNYCIALHRRYYKLFGKHLSANHLKKHLTKVKRRPSKAHWKELGSQSIQDVVERIDRSYRAFFNAKKAGSHRRISPPHFCKRVNYRSFSLKQAGYKFHDGNHVTLLGRDYKYVAHRPFDGVIQMVTIRRDSSGELWLCVICKQDIPEVIPRMGNAIGFDFGLKTFLTGSDGSSVAAPRFFERSYRELRRAQQDLSRKSIGSGNRLRAKRKVEKLHIKIANQRRDWFYKLALEFSSGYADICIEDLNIKAMQRLWGRKISDYAFAEFAGILEYQCTKHGSRLHKVPRFYASSQTCHVCGAKDPAVKDLQVRQWDCPICGTHHDRDVNAAINICRAGLAS